MFVNNNDSVFVASRDFNEIIKWEGGNNISLKHISESFRDSHSLFITTSGDMYVDNGGINHRVDQWIFNTTSSIAVMNVTHRCISLFVDFTNVLYCCIDLEHQVLKLPLGYGPDVGELVAGNGTNGSTPTLLDRPNGIFVDIDRNLYVADSGNNRIQLFRPGDIDGITVAGNNGTGYDGLNFPTSVVLDADSSLFIVDRNNHRIIRWEEDSFRCIVGCFEDSGQASNQLNQPQVLWFDSYGNLFVLDKDNHRVQKFYISSNSCSMLRIINNFTLLRKILLLY